MADQTLRFIIEAQNKADKVFKEVEGSVAKMQSKLKDMQPAFKTMAAVGVAGFAAVTGVIVTSVKAAAESEKQWNRTAKQIELAGLTVDKTLKATQQFASGIQKLTGYSDEYVGMLVGRFLPSVKDLEEAKRMAKVALDMEASGMVTAETAAKALMAAYEGDIMMLKRYVPELRGLDSEMLKNLSSAQRYQLAMVALEGQFGGLAEASGKTFAGQLNILKETFGDLQEKIGEQFIPMLTSLVEKIMPVVEKIMAWVEQNPKLTATVLILTAALFGLLAVTGMLGLALPPIIAAIGFMVSPIGLVIIAILMLVAAIIYLVRHWQESVETMKWLWEGLVYAITSFVREHIKPEIDYLISVFQTLFRAIDEGVRWVLEQIVVWAAKMDEIISWLVGKFQSLIDIIGRAISMAVGIGEKVGGAVGKVTGGVKGVLGGGQFGIPYVPKTGAYLLHRGETVLPAGRGFGDVIVNITGGYFLSETVAEELGNKIIEKVKKTMKL